MDHISDIYFFLFPIHITFSYFLSVTWNAKIHLPYEFAIGIQAIKVKIFYESQSIFGHMFYLRVKNDSL